MEMIQDNLALPKEKVCKEMKIVFGEMVPPTVAVPVETPALEGLAAFIIQTTEPTVA
jgi:hypothetical protein